MNPLQFYIVDVFAEKPLAGNQLAVFISLGGLSSDHMQKLAREMNYSETTFIESTSLREGGYDVRIFTPTKEVPFAGHPTVGTAYLIQQEIIKEPVERVTLNLKCGQIPVDFAYQNGRPDVLWMHQPAPTFGRKLDAADVSPVLGLERAEIDDRFPIQEASTGFPFIIVPLKTLESVKRISISRDLCFQLIEQTEAKALLAFAPSTYSSDNDLNVRVFADYYGTPEDPATGSANGSLAAYLVHNRYFGSDRIDVRVEQGYEISRPSLLFLRAENRGGEIAVSVGGRVQPFARGEVQGQISGSNNPPAGGEATSKQQEPAEPQEGEGSSGESASAEEQSPAKSRSFISEKLKPFGTTVFTDMTARAIRSGAINLAQGFPDFAGPPGLVEMAIEAIRSGEHQYSRSMGHNTLVTAITEHQRRFYGLEFDPLTEVSVFCGATEGLASSMMGLLNAGDEVILIEPFYDSYPVCVAMAGATPRFVTLRAPHFSIDPDELKAAFSKRTKLLVLNSPHNPTGKVYTRDELEMIAALCQEHDVIVLTDEVYEHLVYGSIQHTPMATIPGMKERTLTLSSTGKTFSVTGWKVGWAVGPAALVAAAQAAHQYITFCTATPLQVAVGNALRAYADGYLDTLKREYTERRDFLMRVLSDCGFNVIEPQGTYFIVADFSSMRDDTGHSFANYLVEQCKVAAIPMSVFYQPGSVEGRQLLRFAFCKRMETLHSAAERLRESQLFNRSA